jgi:hypothetical protein
MDCQVCFPRSQPSNGLFGTFGYGSGRQSAEDQKPVVIGSTSNRGTRKARAEHMDGGVFQAVIATDAIEHAIVYGGSRH